MKSNKTTELSKKKNAYVQNFINWISQQPENIVYNITNKLGEFKMKQKKQQDVTLELIYKELINFKTEQQAWNKKQEEFNGEVREFMIKTDKRLESLELKVDAILECPTIKREIKLA